MQMKDKNLSVALANFRDLGGYKTSDGRTVVSGKLFRGPSLSNLTETDKAFLDSLKLKTIIDFRAKFEVAANPDWVPEGAQYYRKAGVAFLDDLPEAVMAQRELRPSDRRESLIERAEMMPRVYEAMATSPQAHAELIRLLLDEAKTPLYFHCAAGKDRTGIFASYFLRVLGVPAEAVLRDYLLSNQLRKAEIDRSIAKVRERTQDPKMIKAVEILLGVSEELMQSNLTAIDEKYGSFEVFIEQGLGLSKADVEKLRDMYLTD